MKKIIIALAVMLISVNCFAQSKDAKIKELLEVTKTKQNAETVVQIMIPQMKMIYPQVPDEFWQKVLKNMDYDGFVAGYVPIYDKHYSEKDIDDLIKFYKSPIGKKVVDSTPDITRESMIMGQQWGKQLGEQIMKDMVAAGYLNY